MWIYEGSTDGCSSTADYVRGPEEAFRKITPACQVLFELDLKYEFFQIPIQESDSKRCTAVSPFGAYLPLRLPMGAKDSQTIMEALVRDHVIAQADRELRSMLPERSFKLEVFRDNVYGGEIDNEELKIVLEVRAEKMTKWNLKIGSFTVGTSSVPILGLQVSADVISAIESNLKKIREFELPRRRKQVR